MNTGSIPEINPHELRFFVTVGNKKQHKFTMGTIPQVKNYLMNKFNASIVHSKREADYIIVPDSYMNTDIFTIHFSNIVQLFKKYTSIKKLKSKSKSKNKENDDEFNYKELLKKLNKESGIRTTNASLKKIVIDKKITIDPNIYYTRENVEMYYKNITSGQYDQIVQYFQESNAKYYIELFEIVKNAFDVMTTNIQQYIKYLSDVRLYIEAKYGIVNTRSIPISKFDLDTSYFRFEEDSEGKLKKFLHMEAFMKNKEHITTKACKHFWKLHEKWLLRMGQSIQYENRAEDKEYEANIFTDEKNQKINPVFTLSSVMNYYKLRTDEINNHVITFVDGLFVDLGLKDSNLVSESVNMKDKIQEWENLFRKMEGILQPEIMEVKHPIVWMKLYELSSKENSFNTALSVEELLSKRQNENTYIQKAKRMIAESVTKHNKFISHFVSSVSSYY